MLFLSRKYIVLFVIVFITLLGYSQKTKQSLLTKKYAPYQLKADAEVLKTVVLKMHPVIGIYNSKEYYEKKFDDFIVIIIAT